MNISKTLLFRENNFNVSKLTVSNESYLIVEKEKTRYIRKTITSVKKIIKN